MFLTLIIVPSASITDQCQKGESHFVQKLPRVLLLNHTYFLGIWSKTFRILDSSAPAMALPLFQSTVCWCVSWAHRRQKQARLVGRTTGRWNASALCLKIFNA